jgi:hypothetical protein
VSPQVPVSRAIRLAGIFSKVFFMASGLVATFASQNDFAPSVEYTVKARSITQVQPDGQLSILQFPSPA